MISFIQEKKLVIYRSWEYCLLPSPYSKSDHWTPMMPKFPPSTLPKPCKHTLPAQDKLWTCNPDVYENLSCLISRAAQEAGGRGGCLLLFNPKLWKMLSKKEVDTEQSVNMVRWFTSNRSHLILSKHNTMQSSPWFNVLLGFCLQCVTDNQFYYSFLGIILRRA